jgi:tetratricopeptide (TPR) repeat protein
VLERFPLDRVAWNNLGLVYWLAGRFPDAVAAYGKTLAIDPEDLNAHYNLMRVFRAMGDRKNADLHDALYRRYKDDETIRAVPGDFRLANPWANRESLPIHVHAEAEPPPAAPAPWVSAMGPKGYETDRGYLTRAHPPVPSEAGQWSYATASTAVPSGSPRAPSAP